MSSAELWRTELATSLTSIRDFQGSPEDREKLMILAFTGYMMATSHINKLPYSQFKVTVDDYFRVRTEAADLRVFMKAALGIDIARQ